MTSEIIGIDPGKTGYVVAIDSEGVSWSQSMPDTPNQLADLLREHVNAQFFVERQFPVRGQGLKSTFTTGRGYGEILGVVAGLAARLWLVESKDWQKVMLRGLPQVKGPDLKRQYIAVAERAWPSISFRGPRGGIHDGKAAAVLIAEYGRRLFTGETLNQKRPVNNS